MGVLVIQVGIDPCLAESQMSATAMTARSHCFDAHCACILCLIMQTHGALGAPAVVSSGRTMLVLGTQHIAQLAEQKNGLMLT